MAKVKIRKPKKGDVDKISKIVEAITKKRPSSGFKRMARDFLGKNRETCLIADLDGEVVGFILGAVREYNFGVQKTGWIEVLGVHPNHMGSSIGKMLGKKMIQVFKKRDVCTIHTAVQWKSGDLLAFFCELGFERSDFLTLELRVKKG